MKRIRTISRYMQNSYIKLLFGIILVSVSICTHAYDFKDNGLCYNKLSDTTVELTYNIGSSYYGDIVIPNDINYNSQKYDVVSIGDYAFANVISRYYNNVGTQSNIRLSSVTIPNSVTSIGNYSFFGCSGLTSITIPNSVTSIGVSAFADCTVLSSMIIPSSVTNIDSGLFDGCSALTSISVSSGNTKYDSRNNCNAIILTAYNALIAGCKNSVIPNSVTSIGNSAFKGCSGLTSITIPNSVTAINNNAFWGCTGLTSITLPNSVTRIEQDAFCLCSALSSITIPNSVTYIGKGALHGCSALTSITIPNSVTSIGNEIFASCSNLTSIIIESGNTKYDSRNNCNAIIQTSTNTLIEGCKNTIIPSSVTSIGYAAFMGRSALTSITIPNSVTSIGQAAFWNCSGLTTITIPNSVTSIGDYAFYGCSNLKDVISEIKIPFVINEDVFSSNTYSTAKLTVPAGTKSAYQSTNYWNKFSNIVESTNDVVDEGNGSWQMIGDDFDKSIPFTKIRIKNKKSSSGSYCCIFFSTKPNDNTTSDTYYNINFYILNIGDNHSQGTSNLYVSSCTDVGDGWYEYEFKQTVYFSHYQSNAPRNQVMAFVGTQNSGPKRTIHVATAGTLPNLISESEKYTIEELTLTGELNGTDFRLLRDMAGNNYLGQETEGKLRILDFSGAKIVAGGEKYLDTDRINGNGKSFIGSFHYDVTNNNVVPRFVFIACDLENVSISNTATSIGDGAFEDCSGLTSITIPNSVTSIGDWAFYGCSGLTSITIPNSVTSIGDWAFYGCSGLTSIMIPNSVTSIGGGAFSFCSGLTSIAVSNGNTKYDSRNNCNAIIETSSNKLITGCKNTVIPNSVTGIGDWAFEYCSGLTSITIPNSVTSIGESAFSFCSGLSSITIPNSVTSIGESAFFYCRGLTSITLPNSITSIGNSAFAECIGLKNIVSEIKNPFEIGESVFSSATYTNAMLTVPKGTKTAYQSKKYWNKFSSIVESGESQEGVTVTAKSYTREYGDANPSFEYTVSGGSISGTPKITCSATKTSAVGSYTIKIEKGGVTNSNVTFVNGTLTITKAPLTITAKSYTRKQGEANPTFEVTYKGFKNNETESVLSKKPTVSTTATTNSSPGTYTISVSGAEAKNYSITYVNGTLTVTQKDQAVFTMNGIKYAETGTSKKVEVQSVDNNLLNVDIPPSVTYNGVTYQVTSVSNAALSGRVFNYVSFPSTITSLKLSALSGTILGAMIWNADASLSNNLFGNCSMVTDANFLLYVNSMAYAPSNVKNIIVGSSASEIVLKDAQDTWFYCPREFTAQIISYTHHYGMTTGGNGKGWETISLPFIVQRIEHKTKGGLTPFASYDASSSQRPFWLYEMGGNGFSRTGTIQANTPYIISMPNSANYDSEYILSGDVTFSATNAKVKETSSLATATSNGKRFVPAFSVVEKASGIYPLNVNNSLVSYNGTYEAGSRFIGNLRKVYPFEAYMTTSSNTRAVIDIEFDNESTGFGEALFLDSANTTIEVYTIGGQRVAKVSSSDYQELWQSLPSGVYVVNGKKVIK